MKKQYLKLAGYMILVLLAFLLIYYSSQKSRPPFLNELFHVKIIGEYSQNGKEWKPIEDDTRFSAMDGDLILRGTLSEEFASSLSFYVDHIGIDILLDGKSVWKKHEAERFRPQDCSLNFWGNWKIPESLRKDSRIHEIEIKLHNYHKYGNVNAFNQFIDSLTMGDDNAMRAKLEKIHQSERLAANVVIIIAILMFGMSWACFSGQLPQYKMFLKLASLCLFTGMYILFDVIDLSYHVHNLVYNALFRLCSMRMAMLTLIICIEEIVTGRRKKYVGNTAVALGFINGILFAITILGRRFLYDTSLIWAIVQAFASLIAIICCLGELREYKKMVPPMLISGMVLCVIYLVELCNSYAGWWKNGSVIKFIFMFILIVHILGAIKNVVLDYKKSVNAHEMEEELQNSYIILNQSQIKMHFIFNLLTAISGMCEYDPVKADETIIRFSRYLRRHIDVMEKDDLVSVSKELEYLNDYVELEKVRYEDKIQFIMETEPVECKIPPLTLQPIVENAIKHGILPLEDGGIVEVHVQKDVDTVVIRILDNGIGFSMEELDKEESVGLRNVRFRLEKMVNGRMDIESNPGHGTNVIIRIPIEGAKR